MQTHLLKLAKEVLPVAGLDHRALELIRTPDEPSVSLTQAGEPVAVLMSTRTFEKLRALLQRVELQGTVENAEQVIEQPIGRSHPGDRAARDAHDQKIINAIADELNAETADALEFQVPL